MTGQLAFDYRRTPATRRLIERIRDCAESLSLACTTYNDREMKGPGLYAAVVATRTVDQYADPMGANRWPSETCRNVHDDLDSFYVAIREVAHDNDGAFVVGIDGTVLEQMVRFRNVSDNELPAGRQTESLEYTDWMGARHMSAYELSLRPDVVVTLTLSEETGRVTTFDDGVYETVPRNRLGEPWRAGE